MFVCQLEKNRVRLFIKQSSRLTVSFINISVGICISRKYKTNRTMNATLSVRSQLIIATEYDIMLHNEEN